MKQTGVDGLLIGRAAQGCPWIFDDINHYLKHGTKREERPLATVRDIILHHLEELHQFYGEKMGHRIARKHVGWYLKARPNHQEFRQFFNKIETPEAQLEAVRTEFEKQINNQINNGEIAA